MHPLFLVNIFDVEAMQAGVCRLLVLALCIVAALLVIEMYFPDKPKRRK